jgi:hypothetical protein
MVVQPAVEGRQRGREGQRLTDVCEVAAWTRHGRTTARTSAADSARQRRVADGGGNGGTLGGATGAARWSSRTWPMQARLRHRPMGQRGRLREGKAQRRLMWLSSGGEVAWRKGSVARSDWSLLKRKGMAGRGSMHGRSVERGEWGPGCRQWPGRGGSGVVTRGRRALERREGREVTGGTRW